MENLTSTAERAVQLADSGDFVLITGIKSRLIREGYANVRDYFACASATSALRAHVVEAAAARCALWAPA